MTPGRADRGRHLGPTAAAGLLAAGASLLVVGLVRTKSEDESRKQHYCSELRDTATAFASAKAMLRRIEEVDTQADDDPSHRKDAVQARNALRTIVFDRSASAPKELGDAYSAYLSSGELSQVFRTPEGQFREPAIASINGYAERECGLPGDLSSAGG